MDPAELQCICAENYYQIGVDSNNVAQCTPCPVGSTSFANAHFPDECGKNCKSMILNTIRFAIDSNMIMLSLFDDTALHGIANGKWKLFLYSGFKHIPLQVYH